MNNNTKKMQAKFEKKKFGNNITSTPYFEAEMNGISEIIDNAFTPKRKNTEKKCINIELDTENSYLYVSNNGAHVDFEKLVNFGGCYERAVESSFGTGYNTGDAFFTEGEGVAFVITKKDEDYYLLDTTDWPSCFVIKEKEYILNYAKEHNFRLPDYAFDEEITTVVAFQIANDVPVDGITEEALGAFYFPKLLHGEVDIMFNGKHVKPYFPKGKLVCVQSIESGNAYTTEINGEEIILEKWEYELDDEATTSKYFAKNKEWNGLNLYKDGRWIERTGVTGFRNFRDTKYFTPHDSFNPYITIVNIRSNPNRENDIPLNNNKTGVNWRKKIGQQYRKALDSFCGDRFRKLGALHSESTLRKHVDTVLTQFSKTGNELHLAIQKELVPSYRSDLKMDLVLGEPLVDNEGKPILHKISLPIINRNGDIEYVTMNRPEVDERQINTIVEYKASHITYKEVHQVIEYAFAAKKRHKNHRCPDSYIYCYYEDVKNNKDIEDALEIFKIANGKEINFVYWSN